MKPFSSLHALILATSSLVLAVSTNAQQQEQPSDYFGGSDNEAYLNWLQDPAISYERNAFLPSKEPGLGVAFHWTADESRIHIAVAAKATGWVGFGLAESGSMRGADIVMFTAETNELTDSYVLDQLATPIRDECQSWTLVGSVVENGFVIFEANRLLDTLDTQDHAIINDSSELIPPTRVIAAWGDTATPSYHGVNNNARSSIRFYGAAAGEEQELFQRIMETEAEGNFTVQANDFVIPAVETRYEKICVSGVDLTTMGVPIDQDLHTIGIEPIVDSRSSKFVHHFVVSASNDPWDSSFDCENYPTSEVAYVWAPGDLPLNLPSDVGGPLGSAGFKSFMIEIHYNNPWFHAGQIDSSGVRFFYTSKKRKHDMGIFMTGDPTVALSGQSVSQVGGLTQHTFNCDGTCSSVSVSEPVKVLREHLHMHKSGASMTNAQVRGGEVIRQGEVQFWDFNQQGNLAVVQEPFEIQSGDSFITTCSYDAKLGEVFGLGSSQEMCIAFLYYYPRQLAYGVYPFMCGLGADAFLPGCATSWTTADLADTSQLGRIFGTAPASGICRGDSSNIESPTSTPSSTVVSEGPTPTLATTAKTPVPVAAVDTPQPTKDSSATATMLHSSGFYLYLSVIITLALVAL